MDVTSINLLILDVDGVLTDGRIVTDPGGDPRKSFHVQDGYAIRNWQRCGKRAAILSGRDDLVVAQRAEELKIELVQLGALNKLQAYESILADAGCADANVAYVGDDLPDLGPMSRCAFPIAVANAVPTVKRASAYVTRIPGGRGAIAEVIELVLRKQGRWSRGMPTSI